MPSIARPRTDAGGSEQRGAGCAFDILGIARTSPRHLQTCSPWTFHHFASPTCYDALVILDIRPALRRQRCCRISSPSSCNMATSFSSTDASPF